MKFTTISIGALSLSSYAFAAPATVVSGLVATVPSKLENTVSTIPKRDYSEGSPVSSDGSPVYPVGSPVITITSSITSLKATIESDLQVLTSVRASNVTAFVAPKIIASLTSIATEVKSTVLILKPVVVGTIATPTSVEIEALISILVDTDGLITEIESAIKGVLAVVTDSVAVSIKAEVIAVLALVMPLVTPLTGFAFGVAGTLASTNATAQVLISAAASDCISSATLLVSPVGPVLDCLL